MDVQQKEYINLVRSHTDSILDISIDLANKYIATCSRDSTVRVWDFSNFRQLYDFSAPNEKPTRVCFHPHNVFDQTMFACGFNCGKIRIFNVNEAKLYTEIKSSHSLNKTLEAAKCEITDLKYTNDGKRLIAADSLKYLSMFNVEREYSLIRLLPNCVNSFGSLVISPDDKCLAVIGPSEQLISIFDSLSLNEALRINTNCEISSRGSNTNTNVTKSDAAVRLAYSTRELNHLLCVTSSNKLLKFDAKTGRLLSSIGKIHRSSTDYIFVSNDGRYLITSGDNSVKIWDYEMRLEKNYQVINTPISQKLKS